MNDLQTTTEPGVALNRDELHLVRQWFEGVEDLNPAYLEAKDYRLAAHVYQVLGWRVPQRIEKGAGR